MEGLPQYIDKFVDFVERAHWLLPVLGLIFVFLCIVSKGFRNFVLGLIILGILVFEGFWFYDHFYSSGEERAALKDKVMAATGLGGKSGETPTPTQGPRFPLRDRKF